MGTVEDVPRKLERYCVDPKVPVQRFDRSQRSAFEQVRSATFDGEGELHGSSSFSGGYALSYVSERNHENSVRVLVARYDSPAHAFDAYTRRTVGEPIADRERLQPLRAINGRAVGDASSAVLWRGSRVAEFRRDAVNDLDPLEFLVGDIAGKLPGAREVPPHVLILESLVHRDIGLLSYQDSILGIEGMRPSAERYFDSFRVIVATSENNDEAKALLKRLAKALPPKDIPSQRGLELRPPDANKESPPWYFRQYGRFVFGVGPALESMHQSAESAESQSKRQQRLEKITQVVISFGISEFTQSELEKEQRTNAER